MNSESPKNEEQVTVPMEKVSANPEEVPTQTPQNTLLNLAKLNTGAPRFEVNCKENEDNENTNQPRDLMPKNGEMVVENGAEEGAKEESGMMVETEKVNGNMEDQPQKLEVPEDELMLSLIHI